MDACGFRGVHGVRRGGYPVHIERIGMGKLTDEEKGLLLMVQCNERKKSRSWRRRRNVQDFFFAPVCRGGGAGGGCLRMGAIVRKVLLLVAFVLGVSGAWGACKSVNTTICNPFGQYTCNEPQWDVDPYCTITYCYTGCVKSDGWVNCSYECDTQCDADSLKCVNAGNTWTENPNATCGKSCNENGCTAQDTATINAQKARCDSLGGTNDFALVNNGAEGCGLSGFCNLCNGNSYKELMKQQRKNCCEQGHVPDTTALKCIVESITSTDKTFNVSGVNKCLSGDPQVIITPDGESYREGCDDPPPPSGVPAVRAVPVLVVVRNGSSSSECIGLDCPSSSSMEGILGDLDWLKDSTHKIIMHDSTIASNSIDLVNYLYDIKTCLESGTCGGGSPNDYTEDIHEVRDTLHNSNTLLKQIADKDLNVEVNGGLTAEKQAELVASIGSVADSAAKYGIANGERLDSIISALKGIGADSVAHGLDSVRNEYIREGIDSLYSLRVGLDSTFADWSDTSGAAAGGDTTGKGESWTRWAIRWALRCGAILATLRVASRATLRT